DSVPVHKLIHVLRHKYHLPDTLAQLAKSFLCNRFQTTRIDGEDSFEQPVISGVPQGSILGPHLFNAYISSVLAIPVSSGTRLIAFADDLLTVKPIRTHADAIALQQDVDAVLLSYDELYLSVNPAKSCFMVCSLATSAVARQLQLHLQVNAEEIEERDVLKYLG
ncbi:MAG: hypothetical protein GY696_03670, partial [Gammaproteobacteria bacterium]|nr:hypothetical protein [Gammaproteobacteria bacterium]